MDNRFIVPQFIDNENKIWGPITVRQFVICLVGALFIFISYKLSDFTLFLFEGIFVIILVVFLAFYRVNGAPFHIFALNVVQTMKKPRIRVWQKLYIKMQVKKLNKEDRQTAVAPVVKKSFLPSRKLSELSLIIDTGGVYKGEAEANKINNISFNVKS
ncbi:MAG: hypothetical protein C3F02_02660 [Parcubacteria group bacterium]|nr:MAG: hypothetical protein C3F02_02660 [Parcubacteria group bacterium]